MIFKYDVSSGKVAFLTHLIIPYLVKISLDEVSNLDVEKELFQFAWKNNRHHFDGISFNTRGKMNLNAKTIALNTKLIEKEIRENVVTCWLVSVFKAT